MSVTRAVLCALLFSLVGCSDYAVLDLFPPATDRADGGRVTKADVDAASPSCKSLASRVHVSYPMLPAPAVPSDEYHPMLLAPRQDGTSFLGYKEAGASRLRVLKLDHDAQVVSEDFQIQGEEAHALLAHDVGGALVYMREDPDIYSAEYCHGPDTPDLPICGSMELVRFDASGKVEMAATLTDKINVASADASFIYWFQHTARLVWAENTYGVYYRSARNNPMSSSPLVSTDSLRFIDADGNRLQRGWTFGCFYSWSVRLAYNGFWAAACHGDISPNAHRAVVYEGDTRRDFTFLDGVAPVDRALGGLVPADFGFWLSYLERGDNGLNLHLAQLNSTPSFASDRILQEAQYIDSDYVFRTYLAAYGSNMLAGWKSNEQLMIAVVDINTGALLEGPVAANAPIDNFVEFVAYPDGDVGWAHSTSSGEVSVTRVQACED